MCASWLQRHRCARGARDGGDTMESGIAVHPLASTEPHGALECAGVALETHDGGVVENNGPTDSAAAKGGENHARHIPESDSPEKPDTPPSRLSLDQLRAEIDAAAAELGCERLRAGAGGKLETYLRRYCPAHAAAIGLL